MGFIDRLRNRVIHLRLEIEAGLFQSRHNVSEQQINFSRASGRGMGIFTQTLAASIKLERGEITIEEYDQIFNEAIANKSPSDILSALQPKKINHDQTTPVK